jgi:hypothetical protein
MASLIISAVALLVSITTAWLTLFRRGSLHMTRPVLVGFLYDLPVGESKVFFRAMLFATGRRGHIVESMFLKLRRGESTQTFNFWMYGETKDLKIGSGLQVGEDGVSFNHHFLPPKDDTAFQFLAGEYIIEVYVNIVKRQTPVFPSRVKISLSQEHAAVLRDKSKGVLFIWGPESRRYSAHVSEAPGSPAGLPLSPTNR